MYAFKENEWHMLAKTSSLLVGSQFKVAQEFGIDSVEFEQLRVVIEGIEALITYQTERAQSGVPLDEF